MYQKPSGTIAARISRKPLKTAARSQSAHTVVGSALRQRAGKRAAIGPAMYVQKKFVHIEPSQRHCSGTGRFPQLLVSLSIGNVRSCTQLSGSVNQKSAKDSERIYNWGYGENIRLAHACHSCDSACHQRSVHVDFASSMAPSS